MAIPILNHLDLRSVSELRNAILHKTAEGNATHAAGKIIYDSGAVKVSDGSAWFDLSGDIKQVKVIADSGEYDVTNGNFVLTIAGDTGITTSITSSTLSIDLDDTSTDMTATNSGEYGSSTAIPVITVDRQGRLTNATTASISTTLTVDADSGSETVALATDDLQILGTSNEIVTAVTKPASPGTDTKVVIGLPDDVTIGRDLTVTRNLDVDGTTNLDDTDIDGTFAVDGTTISLDATTSLNIDNSNTTNGITIGTGTAGVPISIGHTTSEVTVNDNLTVTGNLTVSGSTTTKISETVLIEDNIITLNSNETGTPSENSGVEVERGSADNVSLQWTEGTDRWQFTNDGSTFYNIPIPSEYDNFSFSVNALNGSGQSTTQEVSNGGTLSFQAGVVDATDGIQVIISGDDTITVKHANTSSQSSVNNSALSVVQDVTLDTYGHVTGLTSADLSQGIDGQITNRQFNTTIGNNSATTINLLNSGASAPHKNHGLGTDSTKFMIQLIEVDTGLTVMADVARGSSGAVNITFAEAPDTDKIRVLINKIG